jgi:catechol-2,3-dioxygenase
MTGSGELELPGESGKAKGSGMEVTIQSLILVVGDLGHSIEFYSGVFSFPLVARRQEVAVLQINQAKRSQALVLRENDRAVHPGGGNVGIKILGFEVASPEELEIVEKRLVERGAYVRDLRRDSARTVFGVDPDRNTIGITAGLAGHPPRMAEWSDPDEIIEAIAH